MVSNGLQSTEKIAKALYHVVLMQSKLYIGVYSFAKKSMGSFCESQENVELMRILFNTCTLLRLIHFCTVQQNIDLIVFFVRSFRPNRQFRY